MADEEPSVLAEEQEASENVSKATGESTINTIEGLQESDTTPPTENPTNEDLAQDNVLDGEQQRDEQAAPTQPEAQQSGKARIEDAEKGDALPSNEESAVLDGEESGAKESFSAQEESAGDLSSLTERKCEAIVRSQEIPAVTDVDHRSEEDLTQSIAKDNADEAEVSKPTASPAKDDMTPTDGTEKCDRKSEVPHSRTRPKSYGRATRKDITDKFGGVATSGVLVKRSTSCGVGAVKNMLLEWCRAKTRGREGVDIQNFSSSWSNGLAFCALILAFFPDAFDYDSLDPKNRKENFQLAFNAAEKFADCPPLLDVEDMVRMKVPDSKCVYTYVQEIYRSLVAKGLVKTKKT
ncbi:smoothelin-like protein 1 isoform X1 [Ranitomeya variabilis]|uniref:smoothelin-like protein 1 isoform X1 n=1 Tax=Ranitomeya variabilis TaxID=490064 RepID=UPI0040563A8E